MPLIFASKPFPGSNHAPQTVSPSLEVVRTKFFGVRGESEIRGVFGSRPIQYYHWIFDGNALRTYASIVAFLEALDKQVGTNDTLIEQARTGNSSLTTIETFENVTFDGYQRVGPILQDAAGTLGGGFWVPLLTNWTQIEMGRP